MLLHLGQRLCSEGQRRLDLSCQVGTAAEVTLRVSFIHHVEQVAEATAQIRGKGLVLIPRPALAGIVVMGAAANAFFGAEDCGDKTLGYVGWDDVLLLHVPEDRFHRGDGTKQERNAAGGTHEAGQVEVGPLARSAGHIELGLDLAQEANESFGVATATELLEAIGGFLKLAHHFGQLLLPGGELLLLLQQVATVKFLLAQEFVVFLVFFGEAADLARVILAHRFHRSLRRLPAVFVQESGERFANGGNAAEEFAVERFALEVEGVEKLLGDHGAQFGFARPAAINHQPRLRLLDQLRQVDLRAHPLVLALLSGLHNPTQRHFAPLHLQGYFHPAGHLLADGGHAAGVVVDEPVGRGFGAIGEIPVEHELQGPNHVGLAGVVRGEDHHKIGVAGRGQGEGLLAGEDEEI